MEGKQLIREILKKKLLLRYVADDNAKKNKYVNLIVYILTVITAIISAIETAIPNLDIQYVTGLLSTVTFVVFKVKNVLNFSFICEQSKKQIQKYSVLLHNFENNINKIADPHYREEYIMTMEREFNVLSMNDPEISIAAVTYLEDQCKAKGIPYDDTMEQLQKTYKNTVHINVEEKQPTQHQRIPSYVSQSPEKSINDAASTMRMEIIRSMNDNLNYNQNVAPPSSNKHLMARLQSLGQD